MITSRVLIAVIVVLGVMVAGTFIAYRADLRRAVQRISHGSVVGSTAATLRPAPLERIEARALVVSLEDDLYGTYPAAQYTASHIPGARFMGFPSGGHVWVGHHREIMGTIADFMRERAREATAAGHRDVVDGRAYRSTD